MKKLLDWLKNIGKSILKGMLRFPVTVACALAIMVITLILIHNDAALSQNTISWLNRISSILALGIPSSIALKLFFERKEARPIWLICTLWASLGILLVLYLFFLLPEPLFNDLETTVRYLGVFLAAVVMIVAVPYLPKKEGDERFALKLVWRGIVTGVFTGILIGGISLILLMLDKLLNVNIGDKAYIDNAVICSLLFAPSFFLAGVPERGADINKEPFSQLMKVLIGYIIFPLLTAYTIIIYMYFIRILLMQSWPSNMLVNMVLWYTAIGVLALYFMRSQTKESSWFKFFDKWYPRFTVLPIILMFIGLFIRIGAYGFTEARYMVLALSVWVTCMTVIAIILKPEKRLNIIAPTLFALIALITVLGPLSAFNISKSSQNARLYSLLEKNDMLTTEGYLKQGTDVSDKDKQEIYAILDYFDYNHSLSDVHTLETVPDDEGYSSILGFERPEVVVTPGYKGSHYISPENVQNVFDVSGYDYFYMDNYGKIESTSDEDVLIDVSEDNIFTITKDGTNIYSKSLDEYAKELDKSYTEGKVYTQDELTFTDENNLVKVKYMFTYVSIEYSDYEEPTYYIDSLNVLVDIK
ncbi:MAG: DUF4153 domain-containing protein [Eubacteriales bacterium]